MNISTWIWFIFYSIWFYYLELSCLHAYISWQLAIAYFIQICHSDQYSSGVVLQVAYLMLVKVSIATLLASSTFFYLIHFRLFVLYMYCNTSDINIVEERRQRKWTNCPTTQCVKKTKDEHILPTLYLQCSWNDNWFIIEINFSRLKRNLWQSNGIH